MVLRFCCVFNSCARGICLGYTSSTYIGLLLQLGSYGILWQENLWEENCTTTLEVQNFRIMRYGRLQRNIEVILSEGEAQNLRIYIQLSLTLLIYLSCLFHLPWPLLCGIRRRLELPLCMYLTIVPYRLKYLAPLWPVAVPLLSATVRKHLTIGCASRLYGVKRRRLD